jgi:heme ABC exporter ATP-binding subunit CcmA
MIVARELTKNYGRQAVLRGLSMELRPGEITLLTGSNGAGKTTTLRILAGLARPDSGEAEILGTDVVRARRRAQRQLAFLPQGTGFHPRFTCRQILGFYARLRGLPRERIDVALRLTGLADEAGKRVGALSGGLRQRLGFAVLLMPDAPVLLLDEPGLSLDPEWRERLQGQLRDEAARGKTVLVTTHLLAEWSGDGYRRLSCHDGRVTEEPAAARPRSAHDRAAVAHPRGAS